MYIVPSLTFDVSLLVPSNPIQVKGKSTLKILTNTKTLFVYVVQEEIRYTST